jgi:hypothetical protein
VVKPFFENAKKASPIWYGWMEYVKSVTGLSLDDLNRLVKDRRKWNSLVNNILL